MNTTLIRQISNIATHIDTIVLTTTLNFCINLGFMMFTSHILGKHNTKLDTIINTIKE